MKSWALAALRRLDDLVHRRVEPAVADVLGDRAGEQQRLLEHDADLVAQRVELELADVDAVDAGSARPAGRRSATSRLTSVVLPAPVGPTIATRCPARRVNETSCSVSSRPV